MKKNFDLSLFLGCCVISAGIIVAGWLISKEMPDTTKVPASLAITTTDSAYGEFGEYLSKYELAAYLGITDDDVTSLINAGELKDVSTKLGANYVFVKDAVDEWMAERLHDKPGVKDEEKEFLDRFGGAGCSYSRSI